MIPRQSLFDPNPSGPAASHPPATFLPTPEDYAPEDAVTLVSRRADGWSAANQRRFLEAIAEGHGVEAACRCVGLSTASAYAFRRTAKGAAFALGWRAASLVAREAIAETLLVRALEGQVDTYVRADGTEVTRHRHDNRLAMSLLARLDRQVEAAPDADVKAARLVAQEFDAYLDLVTRDEGRARAGLFLARRCGTLTGGGLGDDDAAARADLAPIFALAAADRLARTGVVTAGEVPVDDLDPAQRAGWTAEQWARAEAAGLLRLAVPAPPATAEDDATDPHAAADTMNAPVAQGAPASQLSQHWQAAGLSGDAMFADPADPDAAPLVWWDPLGGEWLTRFPPPDDFDGEEEGEAGSEDYARSLTALEAYAVGPAPPGFADRSPHDLWARRDQFFASIMLRQRDNRARDSLFGVSAPT
ncbi:hypothetical protein LQ954_10300 [Sphingomonas sp. IC-11]|uniref:hypothetical protein n=1 Tax=Sphingomonas sp. IC-11 TaxID=2898528 RepID=UPI001E44E478|nr:hypothetical protein [Sphingomonas sp. IC-11]MCD2316540.1 hypothetical protein [Sphingomonas sp. IC-11]